ncbi:MAG: hypothetical protein ABJ382_06185, partial [Ilumatobacter sp.]
MLVEFVLYCFVLETSRLDLTQQLDLGLGCFLEDGIRPGRFFGVVASRRQRVALLVDLGHHGVEIVEIDVGRLAGDRAVDAGAERVVRIVQIDQQRKAGRAGADELAHRLIFETFTHLFGFALDLRKFDLRGGNGDLKLVDLGF